MTYDAYLVSHNGLGDNISMIGAVRYLSLFYDKVYFLCKTHYYNLVYTLFIDNSNITCISIDSPNNTNNEFINIQKVLFPKYNLPNTDIFICGCHTTYLTSKITNPTYLQSVSTNTSQLYNLKYDDFSIDFIESFYKHIGLNIFHYYNYYQIPSSEHSIELYNSIKQYYIVFILYPPAILHGGRSTIFAAANIVSIGIAYIGTTATPG